MIIQKRRAVNMTMAGLFAAVLVVLTMTSIPMPTGMPVTLQTFAVALCGYMLGKKYGLISYFVFVALGAVGLPVFSGFHGGFGVLLGLTGGFLWGFFPMVFLCGLGAGGEKKLKAILWGISGLMIAHLFGTAQFSLVSGNPLLQSALMASVPYLIKDVLSVVAAYSVVLAVKSAIKKSGLQKI